MIFNFKNFEPGVCHDPGWDAASASQTVICLLYDTALQVLPDGCDASVMAVFVFSLAGGDLACNGESSGSPVEY